MRLIFEKVPDHSVWDVLLAEEPEIESLALQSKNNTSIKERNGKRSEKDARAASDEGADKNGEDPKVTPAYLPVEWFERDPYPDVSEIKRRGQAIDGLWNNLQVKIISDDVPRIISTPPWPIVNEIAVEMTTKTIFDIVNFALEKTRPAGYMKAVLIAGGDAFKAARVKKAAAKEKMVNSNLSVTGEGERRRYAVRSTSTPEEPTIIPDRGAGFVTFYSEHRPKPRKRLALDATGSIAPRSERTADSNAQPPARFAQFHHPTCLKNKCIVPGELKVAFKFQLDDIIAVTTDKKLLESRVGQAEKVFTQINRYI